MRVVGGGEPGSGSFSLQARTGNQPVPTTLHTLRPSRISLLLQLATALALAACASSLPRPAAQSPSLRLAPAALGAEIALQQRLTVSRDGRTQQADALLEIDANSLRLVLLVGPRRMLTLAFDGQRIDESRDPALPSALVGARFIEDIQLAYWPATSIRAALPPGWTLDESDQERTLRRDGTSAVVIRYSQTPRWIGRIDIRHLHEDYRLRIESVAGP